MELLYIARLYIPRLYIALLYIALLYVALLHITLLCIARLYIALLFIALLYVALLYIALLYPALLYSATTAVIAATIAMNTNISTTTSYDAHHWYFLWHDYRHGHYCYDLRQVPLARVSRT